MDEVKGVVEAEVIGREAEAEVVVEVVVGVRVQTRTRSMPQRMGHLQALVLMAPPRPQAPDAMPCNHGVAVGRVVSHAVLVGYVLVLQVVVGSVLCVWGAVVGYPNLFQYGVTLEPNPGPLSLISPVARCQLLNFSWQRASQNMRSQFQVLTPYV